MTQGTLPGFLRRTIRNVDSADDDDGESSSVGATASRSLIPTNNGNSNSNSNNGGSGSGSSSNMSNNDKNNDESKFGQRQGKVQGQIERNGKTNGNNTLARESAADYPVTTSPSRSNPVDKKFRMVAATISSQKQQDAHKSLPPSPSRTNETNGSRLGNNISTSTSPNTSTNQSNNSSTRTTSPKLNTPGMENVHPAAPLPVPATGTTRSKSMPMAEISHVGQKKMNQQMSYKEAEFEKVISEPVVDIGDLRRLAWNGIPTQHRPQAWKILLGYLPTNTSRRNQTLKRKRSEYRDAIAQHYDIHDHSRTMQEQETLRQVLVDVPRTAPDVPLFRNDLIRQSLARLLYIWAMRHPASSYVQGINDLATPLLVVFLSEYFDGDVLRGEELEDLTAEILANVEADVYWCLTNLLAGIQDHYTQDQPGVQRMVMRLEDLVARIDVGLTQHLQATGVQFMQFAFRWMNCLLLREFHLECIIRLWDTYLSEGDGGFETFHVYVCAAFLCQFSSNLQGMEFDELFGFMQNIPTSNWGDGEIEIVLSQAFVLSTLFQGSDAHLTSSSPRK